MATSCHQSVTCNAEIDLMAPGWVSEVAALSFMVLFVVVGLASCKMFGRSRIPPGQDSRTRLGVQLGRGEGGDEHGRRLRRGGRGASLPCE